jgi:hypothetical protein
MDPSPDWTPGAAPASFIFVSGTCLAAHNCSGCHRSASVDFLPKEAEAAER